LPKKLFVFGCIFVSDVDIVGDLVEVNLTEAIASAGDSIQGDSSLHVSLSFKNQYIRMMVIKYNELKG